MDKYLVYNDPAKIKRTTRALVLCFGIFIFLSPILVIYFVPAVSYRLAVVCVAVTLFSIIVATATTASNAELLAAMAG